MSITSAALICLFFGVALGILIGFALGKNTLQVAIDDGLKSGLNNQILITNRLCDALRYVISTCKLSVEEVERANRIWDGKERYE